MSLLVGDVTKIRSPQITGVPPLHHGSGAFQTMFLFCERLHSVGRLVESLVPLPLGPRHCGQFSLAWLASGSVHDKTAKATPKARLKHCALTNGPFVKGKIGAIVRFAAGRHHPR